MTTVRSIANLAVVSTARRLSQSTGCNLRHNLIHRS